MVSPPWRLRVVAIAPVLPLLLTAAFGFAVSTRQKNAIGLHSAWWALAAVLTGAVYCSFWLLVGRRRWGQALAVLTVMCAALTVLLSGGPFGAMALWAFPSVVIGYAIRPRWAPLALAGMIALGMAIAISSASSWSGDRTYGTILSALVIMCLGGFLASVGRQLVQRNAELEAAREELAAIAVEEERARFGRDLHDLLGHTLSLMTVKVRLAARLLNSGSEEAARELAEVEQLARRALEEIREVAGGYRQPTLASELAGARAALDAAGVRLDVNGEVGLLPPAVEATIAWTVREGVTNVIRHSAASRCRVSLSRTNGCVAVEVSDDGRGGESVAGGGLNGLRQRVESAGGRIDHGPAHEGGFRVTASLPVS